MKNILMMRVGAIGDVIMTTPAIAAVKRSFPQATIDFAVGKWSAPVLENNPDINEIISFSDEWVFEKKFLKMASFAKLLRLRAYDIAFFFDKSWHWSLFAKHTKIPLRIGFNRVWEGFGYHKKLPFTGSVAEYQANLDLVSLGNVNKPESIHYLLYPEERNRERAEDFIAFHNLKNFVALAPGGANNPGQVFLEKRWPAQNYIDLIKSLSHQIVLIGGHRDKDLCEQSVNRRARI